MLNKFDQQNNICKEEGNNFQNKDGNFLYTGEGRQHVIDMGVHYNKGQENKNAS